MIVTRRRFLHASTSAAAAAFCLGNLDAWCAATGNEFRALRRNVGVFFGRGGTIGCLAGPEALLVVDSQYPEQAGDFLSRWEPRGERTIDVLINTHHHIDHTGGNRAFRPHVKRIVAQENVPRLQKEAAAEMEDEVEPTLPDTTFGREWKTEAGDETVRAIHRGAAHTGGDSVVHFQQANVVQMGDLTWNGWHPFIDRPGGASIRGWIDVLETVLAGHDSETLFVFGHAAPGREVTGDKTQVARQRDYLAAVLQLTRAGIGEGKTAEQIAGDGVLPGFEDLKAPGKRLSLPANVAVAYEELTAE